MPAKTLAEFVQRAKEKPDTVTYGSSGIGGAGHLAGELLELMAQIDAGARAVQGRRAGDAGLLGGQIDAYFATPVRRAAAHQGGQACSPRHHRREARAALPDVPTVAESGYPGYEAMNWYAYLAPAKTPRQIVERLNRELVKVLARPRPGRCSRSRASSRSRARPRSSAPT